VGIGSRASIKEWPVKGETEVLINGKGSVRYPGAGYFWRLRWVYMRGFLAGINKAKCSQRRTRISLRRLVLMLRSASCNEIINTHLLAISVFQFLFWSAFHLNFDGC
jgi:hypothetical protein